MIRRLGILALVSSSLFGAAALGVAMSAILGVEMSGLEPPARYVVEYVPRVESVRAQPEVAQECRAAGVEFGNSTPLGCQFFIGKTCYVYRVPDEVVRRHELAHCNGWRHEKN